MIQDGWIISKQIWVLKTDEGQLVNIDQWKRMIKEILRPRRRKRHRKKQISETGEITKFGKSPTIDYDDGVRNDEVSSKLGSQPTRLSQREKFRWETF